MRRGEGGGRSGENLGRVGVFGGGRRRGKSCLHASAISSGQQATADGINLVLEACCVTSRLGLGLPCPALPCLHRLPLLHNGW